MKGITERKWFYPFVFLLLIVISMLPPITEYPYDPRGTQDVILQILMVSITPYRSWGWIFHFCTFALVIWMIFWPKHAGRGTAAYFGVNYLIIAALQSNGDTPDYGFALQTGALIASSIIGIIWLVVAFRNRLEISFQDVPRWRWLLFPLALLVFWSPLAIDGDIVVPNFDPLLLLTSPDYGLTYCFMTPVFLFLLILFYPQVDKTALWVTAFNGLIYGFYNLTHWFNPKMLWLGVMHLPLFILSLIALLLPNITKVQLRN